MKNINVKIKVYSYNATGVVKDVNGDYKVIDLPTKTSYEKMTSREVKEYFNNLQLTENEVELKILEIKPVDVQVKLYELTPSNVVQYGNIIEEEEEEEEVSKNEVATDVEN